MDTRILMLEDTAADAELLQYEFHRANMAASCLRVETRLEFEKALAEFGPNVVLSDFRLPGFDGMKALEIARTSNPEIPFIFVSGTIGEDRAVEALRNGATDYVLKNRLERLVPVVTRALREAEERRARRVIELELGDTRRLLGTIVASLVDVVWSEAVSPRQLLFISPATTSIYQRPPADFYTTPDLWLQLVHPDDRERVSELWAKSLQGAVFDAEYRIVLPGDQTRWIHNRGTPVLDADGQVIRIDGLGRDVTQRHAQQARINRLGRFREVVTSINAAIMRIGDRRELFAEACRIAVAYGGFRMAWIGVAQHGGGKVVPVACHGHDDGYLAEVGRALSRMNEDPGAAARVLRSRTPVIVNDIASDHTIAFKDAALKRGYRSCVVLPLVVEDETAGVLTLYATEAGIFDQEEMGLLMDLASDIGRAMAYIDKSEQLNFLAYHDMLTGLCNRTMLHEHLTQEVAHAQRVGAQTAIVFIDLDNFKLVNDSLGHGAGDRLLKVTADRLLSCLRDVDTVARQGGDEFVVILPDQANPDMVSSALERILDAVAKPVSIEGRQINVTCSMGVSIYPRDGMDADTLLKNADAAMYRAKEIGRNNFQFYASEMNARVNDRLALQSSLRRALDREEFFLHYQPQIDIASGDVIAAEALVRWAHPELGLVPPGRFIPLAEESGLIGPLGEWVLQAACTQIKAWRASGVPLARVAVNLSARQFRGAGLDRQVGRVLAATGVEAQWLELELTESMLMQHGEEVIAALQNLRDMGVKLAIDDFGTGYSSLSYLRRFPVNRLKIDRSFVREMASNSDDAAITSGIIALAHSIHLRVVAEGVESAEQLELLRLAGCDEAQGYYLGRPMPALEIPIVLAHAHIGVG